MRVCSPPASSSLGVCLRRVCPCDRVRVRASESAIRGCLSTGGPLGLRITGGSCVLGGPVKPRVCACAKGTVGALGGTTKKPNAPLAPHPCVRRGSERASGRRVCCPPSSHSSSQEISALCPTSQCGHGGSREMPLTEGLYGSVAFASPPYNFVIDFAPIVQSRPTARRLKDLELLVARRDVEVMLRLYTYWCSESRVWRGPHPRSHRGAQRARSAGVAAVVPNNCEPAT